MRFGKIPVEFVPPGMTPEEARRQRKQKFGPSAEDVRGLIIMVCLLLFLCGGSGWWYFGRSSSDQAESAAAARLEPAQLTATARAGAALSLPAPVPVTPLPPPDRLAASRWFPRTVPDRMTPAPIWSNYQRAALVMFTPTPPVSPLPTPAPPLVSVGSVPSPTPTATINPYDYIVIGHQVEPSDLYSYVSGWVLENDGLTPRPVRVRLRYPTGVLQYPRPNNSDVATGRYEFLVSPGQYWLEIEDGSSPVVPVEIGAADVRHEISFRLAVDRPPAAPAQSRPWGRGPTPTPRPGPILAATPTPTPTPTAGPMIYHNYLPVTALNSSLPRIYFPVVVKND